MEEIASKWDSYSDVQQSGIATALAGTRQRENLITMFENFDLVQKYEQIAANSYGTAAQKMEAYTDSVEAARQRITTSVEKFVLSLSTSKFIKTFYNVVADLTENMYSLAAAVAIFLLAINTKSTTQGFLGGVNTLQQKLLNFNVAQIKMGQINGGFLRGKGIIDQQETKGMKEALDESFLSSQKEMFSKTISSTINSLNNIDEASKTMLKDGMIPLQNSMLDLNTAQKKNVSAILLRVGEENKEAATRQARIASMLALQTSETMTEAALGMVNDEKKRAILAQIQGVEVTKITEEELQNALKDRSMKERMAAVVIDQETPDEVRQTLGVNVGASSRMNVRTAMRDSALTLGTMVGGTWLGSNLGGMLGDGGKTIGASLGAVIGNVASTTIISQLASGATWRTALASLSFLWPVIGVLFVGGIIGAIKSNSDKMKKQFAETASEASAEYTDMLNSSAEAINYDKLVGGVDYLGRNVSLTDEEYQKFLDSSNALAEAFPELVVRTDELGNKFVGADGLSGQVSEVTDKVNELTEASKKAADSELFKMQDVNFLGIFKTGEKSGFSNVFDEQSKIIGDAKYTLNYDTRNVYGEEVSGLNKEIELKENKLNEIGETKGVDSKAYRTAKKELDQLKLDRDALFEDINTAKGVLAEYTDQLISYATTANGQAEFSGQFGGIEDQLNNMSDNGKNLVLSSVKLAIKDMTFADEEDYKNKVLSLTQKAADLLEQNPVIADIYYGVGEFKTLGEQQDAMEKMIPVLKQIFGEDNYDEATQTIIETLGLKIVIDNDKMSIEVPSLGEQFKEQLEKGLRYGVSDMSTENWNSFIGGLTQDQYKQLFDWGGKGWIRSGGANTQSRKDTIMRMLNGGNYYNGTDLDMLSTAANQKYNDFKRRENGRTQVGNDLMSHFADYVSKKAAGEDVDFSSYGMSKQQIASKYADMGEDVWEQIEALQDELENAAPEAIQESLTNGINSIDFSVLEEGLSGKIKAVTEAANQYFSDIDVEGYIDSWKELKDAFASVKDIYDQIDTARKEQNATGRLSVETVLDLLSSNEDYIQALTVEDEKIKLKTNAEEIMNKVRLQTLATSLETKIAEEELEKSRLEAELVAIDTGATYQQTVNDETKATNTAIEANNRHAESLALLSDEALNAADALNLKNRAANGEIVNTNGIKGHTENQNNAKSKVVAPVDVETIDYSKLTEQAAERRQQILDRLEQLYGTRGEDWDYDPTTGKFTYTKDENGHEVGGAVGVQKHLLEEVRDVIKNGSGSGDFSKIYDSYKDASKDAKDAAKDLLKALDSIIDKEWEAMEVWDEYNQKSTGYTAYFEKKRASLERLAGMAKAEMDSATTEEERADAEKDYIEYQKAINNLDDEEIEDKINILELQGASLDSLIAMQKVYIQTSDTEEENIERKKKLLELIHQQIELEREVSEWQRDNNQHFIDRLKGNAYSNPAYEVAMNNQIDAISKEIELTQQNINKYYNEAIDGYIKSGTSYQEALNLAYNGNSDASKSLRDEMTKYYDLIDNRAELTIQKLEDKADELNNRLELMEKEKPQEWFKIGDIDSYYTQRMDLLQKQVELYQDALKDTSDMTDEQIQNIVDSLNEATISLKEAQIDNLKDQTDLQSKQYDAIVYRINLWKDEIQDAIDAIEKAYEDEIKPIQDVSDELERQAELEDLLAAKKAAAKDKERVFRNGIGWVKLYAHDGLYRLKVRDD